MRFDIPDPLYDPIVLHCLPLLRMEEWACSDGIDSSVSSDTLNGLSTKLGPDIRELINVMAFYAVVRRNFAMAGSLGTLGW